jgi:hypothetical protein
MLDSLAIDLHDMLYWHCQYVCIGHDADTSTRLVAVAVLGNKTSGQHIAISKATLAP